MSFFKRVFGKQETPQRSLTSVKDLKKDDIIVLTDSFALPESLRQQQFQVSAVNSYEFESHTQTEWVLTGNNDNEIYLSLDIDDQVYLKFSLKIEHQDVESLFDLDDFAAIFDEPGEAFLERQSDTAKTAGWTREQYRQSAFAVVGYFHRKDHRSENLSAYEGKDSGEQFEQYVLHDAEQDFGIEVEVWSDGDTDVFLTLYRPVTDIIDMYPGS
ncbi:hypothetical protein SG34_023260 [Thalassomonas viridans]|uniref:DUF4178 domain-containing protein n=1 Tax=Thalassomonas viridans TaxID=137584 RepID=A0AAF0C8C9_9GAMM|nr:hypothetical protein [Thalassomonas viridans]WDE04231.1 hypothetical protein SG34_023260 [Thalassomonas viridans]